MPFLREIVCLCLGRQNQYTVRWYPADRRRIITNGSPANIHVRVQKSVFLKYFSAEADSVYMGDLCLVTMPALKIFSKQRRPDMFRGEQNPQSGSIVKSIILR